MRKKRVLLLSEGFGAGHTQAAHALSVSLRRSCPHILTHVMELGTFLHPTAAPWVFNAYRKTVVAQPRLYGKIYYAQHKKSLNRLAQLALHKIFYAQTAEIIYKLKPDLIVCTHPFPNAVISRLKRAGCSIPLCTVITDYDAHGTWINSEVDKYLVSTDEVKHKLLQRGVLSDHIAATGIPVHPSFREACNKEEIRAQLGLLPMPTVMVMGGGWGIMGNDTLFSQMTKWRKDIQFIFCLGSNSKVLASLSEDPRFVHPHIKLLGFTKEIDKLMEISDLLITKPGGMTCSEGLAKGIPMLFYEAIPGQEEENLHYFTTQGLGEPIISPDTINHWFRRLVDHYPLVQERRAFISQQKYKRPDDDCSKVILDMLRGPINKQQSV